MTPRMPARRPLTLLAHPEVVTLLLLILAFMASAARSDRFLDVEYLLDSTSLYMEIGIVALAMTFVVISGNIDLSVASNLVLVAVVCAWLHVAGDVPMPVVAVLGPALGALLGLFNGILVTVVRLPSLAVTLGTLALYRGLAQVIAGDHSIGGFPEWFVGIDRLSIAGFLPAPLVIFLGVACALGLVLHRTIFGRCVYAIGTNESAARFSGMRVAAVKLAVFVLSGMAAGVAATMLLSRLGTAQYNLAIGGELEAITAVVLGGTSIFGGRGTILGTVLALFLLGTIQRGMGMSNVAIENQLAVTGTLLVGAVLLSQAAERLRTSNAKESK